VENDRIKHNLESVREVAQRAQFFWIPSSYSKLSKTRKQHNQ
jgi:hypothetical protein